MVPLVGKCSKWEGKVIADKTLVQSWHRIKLKMQVFKKERNEPTPGQHLAYNLPSQASGPFHLERKIAN